MQTIVFDFGNVVGYFDHRRTLERLALYTDLTAAEMEAAVYGTPLEDAYEAGQISTEDFLAEVVRRWRLRCDQGTLAAAWADIFQPNPEVCSLVPLLKPRYRLLLGSNTNDLHCRQFRRQFADVLELFDGLVMSYQIGVRKPHPGFFAHCHRQAQCPAEKCLFIDDLAANVAGAKACGWQGIVYVDFLDLQNRLRALGILE